MDKTQRILTEGDFFGEISLIYNCPRTATVQSFTYGTLAILSLSSFNELSYKFSDLVPELTQAVSEYDDEETLFWEYCLRWVPYFEVVDDKTISEIMYSLEKTNYDAKALLFNEEQTADKIYFLHSGQVSLTMEVDGEPFYLETLWQGSILNPTLILTGAKSKLTARCLNSAEILSLSIETLDLLWSKLPDLDHDVKQFLSHSYNSPEKINDICLDIVKSSINCNRPADIEDTRNFLTTKLKNCVIN